MADQLVLYHKILDFLPVNLIFHKCLFLSKRHLEWTKVHLRGQAIKHLKVCQMIRKDDEKGGKCFNCSQKFNKRSIANTSVNLADHYDLLFQEHLPSYLHERTTCCLPCLFNSNRLKSIYDLFFYQIDSLLGVTSSLPGLECLQKTTLNLLHSRFFNSYDYREERKGGGCREYYMYKFKLSIILIRYVMLNPKQNVGQVKIAIETIKSEENYQNYFVDATESKIDVEETIAREFPFCDDCRCAQSKSKAKCPGTVHCRSCKRAIFGKKKEWTDRASSAKKFKRATETFFERKVREWKEK
eukprot:Awhi_evm1s7470